MSAFLVIAITVILIIFCKISIWLYKFIKFSLVMNKIPGPTLYPFPTLIFKIFKQKPEDRLQWVCDLLLKYDGMMMIPMHGGEPLIRVCKPHHMEIILPSTENIQKSFVYENLDPWLGKGLLTSTGQKWFHQRKILTPAFHFGVVDLLIDTMSEKAEVLNQIIEEEIKENPGKPIEFFQLAIRCALDIICEAAMGVDMDVQRNHDTEYMAALHIVADIALHRLSSPWLKWDWIFYKTKIGKQFKTSIDIMTNFTMQIIKKRQQARNLISNSLPENEEYNETGKRKKQAFLDLLLDVNANEKNPMTLTELREQVDNVMFAGHDTTAAGINWTIFNLGNNPDIQDKVHEELNQVFGDSEKPASMKEIAELKYLERVIKENLRLNPSVPAVARKLTEDIILDGCVIPKGCNVNLSIFTLHRDPEVWNDPLKFDPDRFLPENCIGRHPYAYVPFSAGPRNCIGQKFAMVEQKVVLSSILRKWRVKSAKSQEEMKIIPTFILRPHEGNPMYFTRK